MALTNTDKWEIARESRLHSQTPEDWNIESLLKEYLWASASCYTNNVYREVDSFTELKRRVDALENVSDEDKRSYRLLIQELGLVQNECGQKSTFLRTKRNELLRKVEDIFKVRTMIADIYLP